MFSSYLKRTFLTLIQIWLVLWCRQSHSKFKIGISFEVSNFTSIFITLHRGIGVNSFVIQVHIDVGKVALNVRVWLETSQETVGQVFDLCFDVNNVGMFNLQFSFRFKFGRHISFVNCLFLFFFQKNFVYFYL